VISISPGELAINAFKLMKDHKISSVAVVEDGVLVGNISISDIKLMEYDLKFFNFLGLQVQEYLQLVNNPHTLHQDKNPIRVEVLRKMEVLKGPVVRCKLDANFGFVIKTMLFYQIHRVYIVDNRNYPIGVVSLQQILTQIIQSRSTLQSK